MSRNKNNDIENIFRKAADEYPADFDERHWQALKGMLDQRSTQVAAVRNGKYKRAAWVLLLLLLLSSGIYWIISKGITDGDGGRMEAIENAATPDEKRKTAEDEESPIGVKQKKLLSLGGEAAPSGPGKVAKENNPADLRIAEAVDSISFEEAQALEQNILTARVPEENNRKADTSGTTNDPEEETKEEDIRPNNAREDDKKVVLLKGTSEKKNEVSDKEGKARGENGGNRGVPDLVATDQYGLKIPVVQEITVDVEEASVKPGQISQRVDSSGIVEEAEDEKAETDSLATVYEREIPVKKKQELNERPLLGVSFTVGPDLSVLGLGEITKPGYSYGLMVHYNLYKKWSIGIGALKTTKRYVGTGDDYKPPKGYWEYATNSVIPERVSGECALIEIPIDIRYDFLRSGRNKFHVSGGVSSYFMRHESYEYDFEYPNPYGSQGWDSGKTEGSHLFNIINFSVGYERDISRKFSLGLAPYVKVPVRGIGWSEVKFVSFGTYFTFKYNFFTRRQSADL